ncbi:hypothetical protein [Euzebya tangerina]|uniref:hypothetical protein n=1 Tax=Euzebya tangerina TaxID=591198 RepID=UPI0013C30009|nr:hypothetical protein [Euzebya tangerina]
MSSPFRSRVRPRLKSSRLGWLLLVLAMVAAGCTDDSEPEPDPTESEAAVEATEEMVTPPDGVQPADSAVEQSADDPPLAAPQAPLEGTLLVTLEGPATNRAATDVVVRDEEGALVEAFRLPNARRVHGEAGSRWALIELLDGSWALLDVAIPRLRLLSFPSGTPAVRPQVNGRVALWADDDGSVLLRLDGGQPIVLPGVVTGQADLVRVSPNGERVLLAGGPPQLLGSENGQLLDLDGAARFNMAPDGTVVSLLDTPEGAVLQRQGPEDTELQTVGNIDQPIGDEAADGATEEPDQVTIPAAGSRLPVPLPDGRVLIVGTASALVQADGTTTAFPSTGSVQGTPRVSPDSGRVLLQTSGGLRLADVDAGTVEAVPGSTGLVPATPGDRPWVWAAGDTPGENGVLAVDMTTGTTASHLEEVSVAGVAGQSDDGRVVVVDVIEDESTSPVVLRADEEGSEVAIGEVVSVSLHPDGVREAAGVRSGASQSVTLTGSSGDEIEISEAWSPVWLIPGR